jgi:hypothetical protein
MVRGRVLMAVVLTAMTLGGFSPSAHALFGRHHSNQPHALRRSKKNTSPYAYLAPRKQKKSSGRYISPVTGEMLYGKQKKKK